MRLFDKPCLNCTERHIGCHADCERYAEAIAKQQAAKSKEREQKMLWGDEMERVRRIYKKNVRH